MSEITKSRPKVKPKKRKLKPKEKLFISNYTNPDSPTFSNATQSVIALDKTLQHNSAGTIGSRLLQTVVVQESIDAIITELGMESKVRLNAVNKVITGKHLKRTKTTSTDSDGKEYTSISETSPSASETLKAIDLVEKITGTYDKNKAKADVLSAECKNLLREHKKALETGKGGGGKQPPRDT